MARMIPPVFDPSATSRAERDVFKRLRDDPFTDEWVVLHSQQLAHHRQQVSGEADFVVLVPGKGVLVIETKGHYQIRREEGLWYLGNDRDGEPRGPFVQASQAMHSIRNFLTRERSGLGGILYWSAAMFPYCEFSVTSNEWHPWQVIDSRDFRRRSMGQNVLTILERARSFLTSVPSARWFRPNDHRPTLEDRDAIVRLLRPQFEFFESPKARRERRTEELRRYTEEQFEVLDGLETNPRVVFEGPAGTGKTMLALEAARRAAIEGRKILLLCFNRLLGRWLSDQVAMIEGTVDAWTLHRFMLDVAGLRPTSGQDRTFWEQTLPEMAVTQLLEGPPPSGSYDEIIVDEAQDILRENYLDVLDLSLDGGLASGRWRFVGDFEKQAIYDQHVSLEGFLRSRGAGTPVYSLRVNCRNTPRMAALTHLLGGLDPDYRGVRRPDDGVEPEVRYFTRPEQQSLLIQLLEGLYEDGYKGKDIVILSPSAASSCADGITEQPWVDRLAPLREGGFDKIGHTTIHAFKGLEAPVIIVTDIEGVRGQHYRPLFYVAVTRALERLILLIDERAKPEVVQALTGRAYA